MLVQVTCIENCKSKIVDCKARRKHFHTRGCQSSNCDRARPIPVTSNWFEEVERATMN